MTALRAGPATAPAAPDMPVELIRGNGPLVVAMPYAGTNMPRVITKRLADPDQIFAAPDRFLPRLLRDEGHGASVLQANFHRFLSDADHVDLPGSPKPRRGMIGPVPVLDKDGANLWDRPPGPQEAASWRAMYFAPYQAALTAQLARKRALHGHAILLNLRVRHDLGRSEPDQPKQFIGFADGGGHTSAIKLSLSIINLLKSDAAFAPKLNGDVAVSGTTRRHGRPKACVHAFDLVLSEASYLKQSEKDVLFDAKKASAVQGLLSDVIRTASQWEPV